ncbi:hypothetical protein AMTRI_Chr07g79590 [Amborella trichopoda]
MAKCFRAMVWFFLFASLELNVGFRERLMVVSMEGKDLL